MMKRSTLLMAFVVAACGGGGGDGPTTPPPSVSSIRLDFAVTTIAKGQPLRIGATPLDAAGNTVGGKTVSWTSADAAIVRVESDGSLTGVAPGATSVTASADGKSASASVTVVAFLSIQPGPRNTCAITVAGRLYCAGADYGTRAKPEGGAVRFTRVSSNGEPPASTITHLCAISTDADAYCWGSNAKGELGIGNFQDRATPTAVVGGIKFKSVAPGRYHTCALSTTGVAYCWGGGEFGQLGNGNTANSPQPVAVAGTFTFDQLESGKDHACGLVANGRAYCWGSNELGTLGIGDAIFMQTSPTPVAGDLIFTSITSKTNATCGLTTDRKTYCWGDNTIKQLGIATPERCGGDKPCSRAPLAVAPSLSFSALATSQFATCGVTAALQVHCWGGDMQRMFGSATPPAGCDVPGFTNGCTYQPTPGPSGFASVAGGHRNYCGVRSDGIAYCWGGNDLGQLGYPGVQSSPVPVPFSIDPGAAQ